MGDLSAAFSANTVRNFREWFLEGDIRTEFRALEEGTEKETFLFSSIPFTFSLIF
jgi:hypothetical protein